MTDSAFIILDEEYEAPSRLALVENLTRATLPLQGAARSAAPGVPAEKAWTSKALIGSQAPAALEPSATPARLPRIAWPASRVAVFVRMRPPVLANEGETAVHAVRESGDDVPFTSIEVRPC